PNTIGIGPEGAVGAAAPQVAAAAARTVRLGEDDGVGSAVEERGGDAGGPIIGAFIPHRYVGEHVGIGHVIARAPAVGAAVGGHAHAVLRAGVGRTVVRFDDAHVLPSGVAAGTHHPIVNVLLLNKGK